MLISYIKIVLRNILAHKINPLINIVGLIIGLTVFILIVLYIDYELSYDMYHSKHNRIYRVLEYYEKDGVGEKSTSVPFPLALNLQKNNKDLIDKTVRFFNFQLPHVFIQYQEKKFYESRFFFTDSTVFDIFDFDFIYGNPQTALTVDNSVVITESMAKKYFGTQNAFGKNLIYEEGINLKITGIIKDIPINSHFIFDFLASFSTIKNIFGFEPNIWAWNPCWTYVLLKENVNPNQLDKSFEQIIDKKFDSEQKNIISFHLQSLTDIHLKSFLDYEIEQNNNIIYLIILITMVIFILIITIINYTNLTTASSIRRAKEVVIKKIHGARRIHLIFQFIVEAIFFAIFSLIISLTLSELLLPYFNIFIAKDINFLTIFKPKYILLIISISIASGIISGIYPAIVFSAYNPTKVLKQNLNNYIDKKFSRKVLVIIQYTISIVLIICTMVNFKQFIFLRNADVGFDKENVIMIPICNTPLVKNFEKFKTEILKNNEIINLTGITDILGVKHNTIESSPKGFSKNTQQTFPGLFVEYDFVKTFGIEILAGRDFSKNIENDNINGILINEAMAKYLGCKNYEEALGKELSTLNFDEKIIGVFKDFNVNSLHYKIAPFIIKMPKDTVEFNFLINYIAIKINSKQKDKAIKIIQDLWVSYSPTRPLEYSFLNTLIKNQYHSEFILVSLSLILSVIAILIASLGVLGLTTFITEQRTKEIGVRKVLGAGTLELLKFLLLDYVKLIFIAIVFAIPISYFLMSQWLLNFAYPIDLNIWIFVLGVSITLLFALIIVPYQAIKAVYKNPVDALKYE